MLENVLTASYTYFIKKKFDLTGSRAQINK